jgi:diguanylate cyclase (GGDEF)-like protein
MSWFSIHKMARRPRRATASVARSFADRLRPVLARLADSGAPLLPGPNARLEAALSNMPLGLVMFDGSERIVVCNDRYIEMYGLSRTVAKPGCPLLEFLQHRAEHGHPISDPEGFRRELLRQLSFGKTIHRVMKTADGREISIVNRPMPDGGWIATHEDITEQRTAQAKISHMALHDGLTDLPNRLHFRRQLESRFAPLGPDQNFSVLCFDLDRFKSVNDSLGHAFGDELLQKAAERMRGCLGSGDMLARLGGDEFAILQPETNSTAHVSMLASRLNEAIRIPFDLDGHQVAIGVSIGIAIAPADGSSPDQLMRNADVALYRAKTDGRGTYRFFSPEMIGQREARRTLEYDLRSALINGEFEVRYQPLVDLHQGAICGFEAQLRWHHPVRGLVLPSEFAPLAEEAGLIVSIGDWMLRQACREAARWPDRISLSINVSPTQMKAGNLAQAVIGALAQSGLPARRFELEITEQALLLNDESTLATLVQLRSAGVRIAMDDFGTGYSSLSNLRAFRFDKIKIDRSFVQHLGSNEESTAIARALIALARSLGFRTTAEGVETSAQLDFLCREGCDEAQGHFLCDSQAAQDVDALLAREFPLARTVA